MVEDAIKIRRKYLEALENEEFEILPGRVYVKGFLKNYAGYLGLDAGKILSLYKKNYPEHEEVAIENENTAGQGDKRKLNLRPVVGVLLLGAILAVGAYGLFPSLKGTGQLKQPPQTQGGDPVAKQPGTTPPASDNKGPDRANNGETSLPGEKEDGVNLVLNVTQDTSWMQVVVDDQVQFTGEVPAGQSKSFRGEEKIWIKLGNAGVVEVHFNGKNIGVLGARGHVVKRLFSAIPQG